VALARWIAGNYGERTTSAAWERERCHEAPVGGLRPPAEVAYAGRGEPLDDVFQVACVALLKAIKRYDVTRGGAFSSYAVPTIVGEIKRHLRDRTWSVRPPRDLLELTLTTHTAGSSVSFRASPRSARSPND
jgi:RNA polymerase sigma-B factor